MRYSTDLSGSRQGSAGPSLTRRHAMTWRWPLVQPAHAATFSIPCAWPGCRRKGKYLRRFGTHLLFLCATHGTGKILRCRLRLPACLALRRSLFGPAGLDGFPGNRLSFLGRQGSRPGMPAF